MMNPAQAIIDKFGGPAKVAALCNCHISRVHRWTYPKERGGSDGIIPPKQQTVLLAAAPGEGVELSRDDFFPPIGHKAALKKTTPMHSKRSLKGSNASKDCSPKKGTAIPKEVAL